MTNNCNSNTEVIQYADDTLIFAADKNPAIASGAIATQIERLRSYFEKNNLQLNVLKTEFVIFSKHANPGNFILSINIDETIHASKSMKDLGISMDFDMSIQSRIKTTFRKKATSIRTFHQIQMSRPSKTRLVLLKTLVLSQLEYRILLFTGLSKTQINSLDKQINWGIQTAFFRKKIESLSDLKAKHQIMSFEGYLKYTCLNYFCRLLKGQIASFNNFFMFPNTQLKYNTRILKLSSQLYTHSAVIRNSFAFFTRKQWNQLSRSERK